MSHVNALNMLVAQDLVFCTARFSGGLGNLWILYAIHGFPSARALLNRGLTVLNCIGIGFYKPC